MTTALTTITIDLNADLGEGYGVYTIGDDPAMLDIVTSANVACGYHGGDPEIMHATFAMAKDKNVAVGAHPGFPDLWGFGRRTMQFTTGEIERLVAYQVGAAIALSHYAGHPITYVKPHGMLGNMAEHDVGVATAIINAVQAVDRTLPVVTVALSHCERIAHERGVTVFAEIFADRAYTDDGHLAPRKQSGAVLSDPEQAAARILRMLRGGAIETLSGKTLPTRMDTICVHGDKPQSVAMARVVREALTQAGVTLRALT